MSKRKKIVLAVVAAGLLFAVPAISAYYDGYFMNVLVRGLLDVKEQSAAPGTPDANVMRLFASDESGTTTLWSKDPDGLAKNLSRRSVMLPLADAFINNSGDPMGKDGTTVPGLALVDGVPAIVYANSTENQWISWTFRLPDDFTGDLAFRILASGSVGNTWSPPVIQWAILVQSDDTAFVTVSPDSGSVTLESTANVSNSVLDFALNTAGSSLLSAGRYVTLQLRNRAYGLSNTTEIKSVQALYH